MKSHNRYKRITAIALALLMAVSVFFVPPVKSLAGEKEPVIAKTAEVFEGKTVKLKVQANDWEILKIASVKSSDKAVAKASATQKKVSIKGLKPGTAKVTVKLSAKNGETTKDFTFKISVTVTTRAAKILSNMTLEQKVSQMIMPCFRTWESSEANVNVTDLNEVSELAAALRKHQYGGVILFGQNITSAEQVLRLIDDLQQNNAKGAADKKADIIPYLVSCDQEGGAVNRFSMGTRGTGSMAIGATGYNAADNAFKTGQILGEEMAAVGINVNLGPCIDVIKDLTDLGMSTRVYSDDPDKNALLGLRFAEGVGQSNVITTYKHFPGAGDGSDYPTAIRLSLDELQKNGLLTYKKVIDGGAEMVMTSATTFPEIDDLQVMADGMTKGYYPATISKKIVTDILRNEYGFDGVVITDALEMQQFIVEPDTGAKFFPEDSNSVEHGIRVAKMCINAGCDILLIPIDLNDPGRATYYDRYIEGIMAAVKSGDISEELIDKSVMRILSLKEGHGILDLDTTGKDLKKRIKAAKKTVGSAAHHEVEAEIARQAVTLYKNTDGLIPVMGKNVLIVGCSDSDATPVNYALAKLKESGIIGEDINVVFDRFYSQKGELVYPDSISDSIKKADVVISLSRVSAGIDQLQDTNPIMQGVERTLNEAHAAGAEFVLLSANIPVDVKRFTEADAIVCAYLSAGYGVDPIAHTSGSENVGAFNANVPAGLIAIFGGAPISGKLPIIIPELVKGKDGMWTYAVK